MAKLNSLNLFATSIENIFPILLFALAGFVVLAAFAFLAWGLWFYHRTYSLPTDERFKLEKMPPVPNIVIAVDFDGTLVRHEFPNIGNPVYEAFYWLKRFQDEGASLILYTMRDKEYLQAAIEYCEGNGVKFYAHQTNPTQGIWTTSPKCYAHLYIDDAAVGCPLIYPKSLLEEDCPHARGTCTCQSIVNKRPWADWDKIGPLVLERIKEFNQVRKEHHQVYVRST